MTRNSRQRLSSALLKSVAELVSHCESPIEILLGAAILLDGDWGRGIRSQYRIGHYRLDFAFPGVLVAIECDGHQFHSTKEQRGSDATRDRYLAAKGWFVLRCTGTELYRDLYAVVDDIRNVVESRIVTAVVDLPVTALAPIPTQSQPIRDIPGAYEWKAFLDRFRASVGESSGMMGAALKTAESISWNGRSVRLLFPDSMACVRKVVEREENLILLIRSARAVFGPGASVEVHDVTASTPANHAQ